ncbi:MAG TPA: hypothetical protein VK982_13240, partial [Bacteroidales bacterium]|nr:hypothetical protein [Bacteroidales bacterium]
PNKKNKSNFDITIRGSRPGNDNDMTIEGQASNKIQHTANYQNLTLDELSRIVQPLNVLEFGEETPMGK